MQWQFRKVLDSIQTYRVGSQRFVNEIQKGTPGALNTIVREIQLIIAQPKDKIISKVLAMRFARDIMILGRQDVINQLTKLVPHMLKVCSYHLDLNDPNRGESYFFEHPEYSNGSPTERQDIERLGSTYFTLNLESIYFWAKWVPADQYGNQSIYSKGLNTLFQRGVKFNNTYHYYKNSDTEKFKNTYKVEFFSQESVDFESSCKSSKVGSQKGNQSSYQNVEGILTSLHNLQSSHTKRFDKLEQLNKNVVSLLEKKYSPNTSYAGKQKNQKRWLENFIINYNLLVENKIPYEEFMKRATTQQVEIHDKIEVQMSQSDGGFRKTKTSAKREMVKKASNEDRLAYQQAIKKQQQDYRDQRQQLKYDITQLNKKLQEQRVQHQSQLSNIVQDYEDRIKIIKQRVANGNSMINQPLIKQNEKLKQKVYDLQKCLMVSRSREQETDNLVAAYEMLKEENQNLKKSEIKIDDTNFYKDRIKGLEKELENQRSCKVGGEIKEEGKKYKENKNLIDELNIYKNQLKSERESNDRKSKLAESRISELEVEIRGMKQKNKVLQKRYDLKQIEIVQLNEHIKIIKQMNKNDHIAVSNEKSKARSIEQKYKVKGRSQSKDNEEKMVKSINYYNFKKYQVLRNQYFNNDKQRYLRFCKCGLKKKDLLLKENQMQIGIISEVISNSQVKFIIHLTNMSEYQINQIRLNCETSNINDYHLGLETQYIFCLQPNEQEKANLFCRSTNCFLSSVYNPIILAINFIKNGKGQQTRVIIPFVLLKTIEQYKTDRNVEPNRNQQILLTFSYSHKMIPNPKALLSYFPQLQQISPNRYECDLLYRENRIFLRLSIQLKEDNKLGITLSPVGQQKAQGRERQIIIQDLMGFFQFCFRR